MDSGPEMPDYDAQANFAIGRAVLHALVLVTTAGLFLASLFLCRQRGDRARSVVRWMKAALFFTGVYIFFDILYCAFYAVYMKGYIAAGLLNVFGPLSGSFNIVYKTVILVTLSSFARGLLLARAGQRAKLAMPVAAAMYVLTAVNCVLAVAYLGLSLWFGFGDAWYRSDWVSLQLHANRIQSVPLILVFIGSLASLAASVFIFTKVKTEYPTLKKPTVVYMAASFLFFVSSLYEIIGIGLFVPLSPTTVLPIAGPYVPIVSAIFSTLPALFTLAAVFHTTRVKEGGLASVKGVGSGVAYNPAPGFGFQGQPMGQPMQSPPAGYQGGFFPQGAQPQGWQPQAYHYAPPGQQQQFAQSPPAQVPSPQAEVQTEHVNPHIKY